MNDNKLLGQGRTAEIFLYDEDKIVKLFKKGVPQSDANLEYEINIQLEKTGIPRPQIYNKVKINGRYGIIYEQIQGNSMLNDIFAKPWSIIKNAQNLADLHLQIHSFEDKNLPLMREKLIKDISRTDLLSDRQKDQVTTFMEQLKDDSIICHGDFHPDNVLLTAEGPVIIDWLTASRGNPAADVARTSLLLKTGTVPPGTSKYLQYIFGIIRGVYQYMYIKRYLKKSAITKNEIDKWILPMAAARLSENLPEKEKLRLKNIVERCLYEDI